MLNQLLIKQYHLFKIDHYFYPIMDKIRLFEFITVVLPALVFILLLMLIFGVELPQELDSESLLFLIAALPISLFFGHLFSHFGGWVEHFIGKVIKQKHPIVDIFNKQFPEVRDDLSKMFPNTVKDNSNDGEMDKLFDKGRTLLYQQAVSYTHLTLPTILLV